MIPLNMNKQTGYISINYENESDYSRIFGEIEDNFYKQYDLKTLEKSGMVITHPPHIKQFDLMYRDKVINKAHRFYYNSCDYHLRELLNHFKSIKKIYGDYLILDYHFKGIYLSDNDNDIVHCYYSSDDESFEDKFNPHLLGEKFTKFIDFLTSHEKLGDIVIESINLELLHNKPIKGKRKRTNIPRGLRHEVFKRDNYTCVECGAKKEDGATLHVDHKLPVSKGGTDELDNLQTLCSDCNLNKSNVIQQ